MPPESVHPHVALPPPLVFLGYAIGALLLNWALPLAAPAVAALRLVGGFAIVAGLLLGISAVYAMMRAHTSPDPEKPSSTLVTDGPYRLTRNPIYLGFFIMYLGLTLFAGTLWGMLLGPILIATVKLVIIRREESYLQARFGDEYTAYRARVRQWI